MTERQNILQKDIFKLMRNKINNSFFMGTPLYKYWVVEVDDYHSFEEYKYAYTKAGIKTDFKEVCGNGLYHAVFWIGKKTKQVNEAISKLERDLT